MSELRFKAGYKAWKQSKTREQRLFTIMDGSIEDGKVEAIEQKPLDRSGRHVDIII